MEKVQEVRIPLVLDWANVVHPGDTLVIGLAQKDDVATVAQAMQAVIEPLGAKVVVLDNVAQMMVVRPKDEEVA